MLQHLLFLLFRVGAFITVFVSIAPFCGYMLLRTKHEMRIKLKAPSSSARLWVN